MSWSDEEIDKIFREANLKKEAPIYQDSYFDEIEHLLPKKRNNKIVYFSFVALALFAISLVSFFLIESESLAKSNLSAKNNKKNSEFTKEKNSNTNIKSQSKIKSIENFEQNSENTNFKNENHSTLTKITLIKSTSEGTNSLDSEILNEITQQKESSLIEKSELLPKEKLIWSDFEEEQEIIRVDNLGFNSIQKIENQDYNFEIQALNVPLLSKKNKIYAEISLGFSESFAMSNSNSTIKSSNQVYQSLSLASGYIYAAKKYNFGLGLNFTSYQVSDLILSRQSKVYDFEVNKYSQDIDYKNINVLEFDIFASRKFKNQQLGIGILPGYVLGSTIQFTKFENDIQVVDERIYWNKLGMNNFTLRPQLSYSILLKNIEIGTKISCILINPLSIEKFNNSLNKNPFQAQISLRKTFKIK
jgi:hypothetical protein